MEEEFIFKYYVEPGTVFWRGQRTTDHKLETTKHMDGLLWWALNKDDIKNYARIGYVNYKSIYGIQKYQK